MRIADLMLEAQAYRLDEPARGAFRAYLERRTAQRDFAKARSVRNALDRIKLRQANRVWSGGRVTRDDLARIDAADILQSRVFREPAEPTAPLGPAS